LKILKEEIIFGNMREISGGLKDFKARDKNGLLILVNIVKLLTSKKYGHI
jgi:hypothetical protein